MTSLNGQSFGRYHILEQLGEGGMATVYKAYDTRLEREVAVKVIRVDQFAPAILAQILKRFEREAKAMALLTHPNIVHVNDYGDQDGIPYLVMDYLPGGTLKQLLKGKPMPWQDAAKLLLPMADALAYAHKRNILHRDVKPGNILMAENDRPMLTDFGIAKILDLEQGQTLTGTGVGIGTPEYMSPEQGLGRGVDARTDIYSLGVVLYELVTGRKPYTADTPMAVVDKHVHDPLPRPSQVLPGLPDAVEKLLLKMLAKSPDDRYPSMAAVTAALEGLLSGAGVPTQLGLTQPVDQGARATMGAMAVPASPPQKVEPKTSITPEKKPKLARWQIGITVGVVGLLCLGLLVAGVLYAVDRSGVFSESTVPVETTSTSLELAPRTEVVATQSPVDQTPSLVPTAPPALPPTPTIEPSPPVPTMSGFEICFEPCNGRNAVSSIPERTTKVYARWNYDNIPAGATYVRYWTQAGREWIRYECIWPNPSSGEEEITLTEPKGLHSGEWIFQIYINGELLLKESFFVEGSWTYWDPAGTFYSCYGK
jgi:serine/threonine protein kinase